MVFNDREEFSLNGFRTETGWGINRIKSILDDVGLVVADRKLQDAHGWYPGKRITQNPAASPRPGQEATEREVTKQPPRKPKLKQPRSYANAQTFRGPQTPEQAFDAEMAKTAEDEAFEIIQRSLCTIGVTFTRDEFGRWLDACKGLVKLADVWDSLRVFKGNVNSPMGIIRGAYKDPSRGWIFRRADRLNADLRFMAPIRVNHDRVGQMMREGQAKADPCYVTEYCTRLVKWAKQHTPLAGAAKAAYVIAWPCRLDAGAETLEVLQRAWKASVKALIPLADPRLKAEVLEEARDMADDECDIKPLFALFLANHCQLPKPAGVAG